MQQSNQNMENKNNDLTEIITQVLNEMKMELGDSFDIDKVNLPVPLLLSPTCIIVYVGDKVGDKSTIQHTIFQRFGHCHCQFSALLD